MNPESQVSSLELAKRLKGLGVKQESFFYWSQCKDLVIKSRGYGFTHISGSHADVPEDYVVASAFTVAELGEMMAKGHYFDSSPYKSQVDARAKMLIYLIEKGLVKP